jgi:hypothetical protein
MTVIHAEADHLLIVRRGIRAIRRFRPTGGPRSEPAGTGSITAACSALSYAALLKVNLAASDAGGTVKIA